MAIALRRFRAKANMSSAEAARRTAAALCAQRAEGTAFPPSLIADRLAACEARAIEGAAHQDEITRERTADHIGPEGQSGPSGREDLATAPADDLSAPASNTDEPITIPEFAPPHVTIILLGPERSGKSALAHRFRADLAQAGIACEGPEGLRTLDLRKALASLIYRGLAVEIRKLEPGSHEMAQFCWDNMPEEWRIALGGRLGAAP